MCMYIYMCVYIYIYIYRNKRNTEINERRVSDNSRLLISTAPLNAALIRKVTIFY